MKNSYKLLSDFDLVEKYQINIDQDALLVLLERHASLLRKLATQNASKIPLTTLEDNLQNAKIGAIISISRFDLKRNNKFSTFLYKTVYYHLLSCNDDESFVKCPSNLREVKSYAANKYSGEQKNNFEKKYNLKTQNDIESFKNKYSILSSNSIQLTDVLPERFQSDMFSEIDFKLSFDSLPQDEKIIANLIMEGNSISDISKIFPEITYKKIKEKISHLKRIISL